MTITKTKKHSHIDISHGVVLPKGLTLRRESGNLGIVSVSVVSSGSVTVHTDDVLGEIYSYGSRRATSSKTKLKSNRSTVKAH